MARSILPRLHDILAMIDTAGGIVAGRSATDYRADPVMRLAVERCIEIVSEASRYIPADDKARFPEIPWPEIAAVGNRLRHEYHRLDDMIIWQIATMSLPELRPVIVAILNSRSDD